MIALVLTLAVVGFLCYCIETWIPMAQPFKIAIYAVIVLCLILWLIQVFGVADVPLPRLNR